MDLHAMVKVEDKHVVLVVGGRYKLDPAVDSIRAGHDAAAIRATIEHAVEQHAAAEATPDGYKVTFPFEPRQRVRVKETGDVKIVDDLRVNRQGELRIYCVVDENSSRIAMYRPAHLEAIPKTALEVLEELKTLAELYDHPDGFVSATKVMDKIAELEKALGLTPAAGEQRKET